MNQCSFIHMHVSLLKSILFNRCSKEAYEKPFNNMFQGSYAYLLPGQEVLGEEKLSYQSHSMFTYWMDVAHLRWSVLHMQYTSSQSPARQDVSRYLTLAEVF